MRRQPPAQARSDILGLSSPTITCFSAGTNRQVLGVVRHCLALKVSPMCPVTNASFYSETVPWKLPTALADRPLIPILVQINQPKNLILL